MILPVFNRMYGSLVSVMCYGFLQISGPGVAAVSLVPVHLTISPKRAEPLVRAEPPLTLTVVCTVQPEPPAGFEPL
jgi:hypothetical protein